MPCAFLPGILDECWPVVRHDLCKGSIHGVRIAATSPGKGMKSEICLPFEYEMSMM